jgi:signal peptidase I
MTRAALRRSAATGRRILSTVLLGGLTLAGAAIIVPSLLGFHLYAIATGSMAGELDPGTLALSREVPVADLAVGDVVTYVPPAETGITHPVTHRIADVDVDEGVRTFTTKGDANASVDPWTFQLAAPTQARVEHALPLLGQPVLWLADPTARLLAIGVPAVLVGLFSSIDLVRALRPTRGQPAGAEEPAEAATAADVAELPEASPAHPATEAPVLVPVRSGRGAS